MKKFYLFLLASIICLPLLNAEEIITLGQDDLAGGEGWSYDPLTYVLTVSDGANLVITGSSEFQSISVEKDATASITLRDVQLINGNGASPIALEADENEGATLTLILEGENYAVVNDPFLPIAAINVEGKATINIEGSGSLFAYGSGHNTHQGSPDMYGGGAGIGANNGSSADPRTAGTINIKSGFIYAHGGYNASAIGGGYYGAGGNINISGGTVFCTTVGGGSHGDTGNINITGGTVIAAFTIGARVNNAGIGSINISGNSIVFDADDWGHIASATVTPPAKLYVGDNGTEWVTATFFEFTSSDPDRWKRILTGSIPMRSSIEVAEGTTFSIPKEIEVQTNGYDIENNGNILVYRINNIVQQGGDPIYGNITGWTAPNGTINGSTTAINTLAQQKNVVYASNGSITIEGENLLRVVLVSLSGQTLLERFCSGESTTIPTNALPSGVYLVRISSATGTLTEKVIVR